MNLNSLLQNRRVRLGIMGGVAILVLVVAIISLKACNRKELTEDELRMQHIEYLIKVVEAYKQRYGSYPQPTARMETPEGIRHVWGYEPKKPSLASCTVKLDGTGAPDAAQSHCGGGVYDLEGTLIGWKGVLTLESGENNIEVAERGTGRVSAPLSEFVQTLPADPAYAKNPALSAAGFGEYVYAIRNATAHGGQDLQEYQLAATFRNVETGEEYSVIRGNYFLRSEERDRFPVSLVGPGILFDAFGNPVEGQQRPLHSLLDGQRKGYPNPVLGDGEETLRKLMIERRAQRLLQSMEERIVFLGKLDGADSLAAATAIQSARSLVQEILDGFSQGNMPPSTVPPDLVAMESDLGSASTMLQQAMDTFIRDRAAVIGDVLEQEINDRDAAMEILRMAFELSKVAEESVLAARDEVLTYFDGKGIEEQTRSRVARKLEGILEDIPDFPALFVARNLRPMDPFLTKNLQDDLVVIEDREQLGNGGVKAESAGTGSVVATYVDGDVMNGMTTVSTVAAELSVHFRELRMITNDLLDAILSSGASIEEIDTSLKNLAAALSTENERIGSLFDSIVDVTSVQRVESAYAAAVDQNPLAVMKSTAEALSQKGDFSGLLFTTDLLERVLLMQSPGIPDGGMADQPTEATYQGIPYPLP